MWCLKLVKFGEPFVRKYKITNTQLVGLLPGPWERWGLVRALKFKLQ